MSKIVLLLLFLLGFAGLAWCADRPAEAPRPYPAVVIYTISSCPHCKEAKRYLTDNHVPFTDREITGDPASLNEMIKIYEEMGVPKSSRGVPLIIIGGRIRLSGFDRDKLRKALQEATK